MHHRSVPRTNAAGELLDANDMVIPREEFIKDPNRAVWIANQGVRTSRIVAALTAAAFARESHAKFRAALLELWEGSRLRNQGQAAALRASQPDPASEVQRPGSVAVARGGVIVRITVEPGA